MGKFDHLSDKEKRDRIEELKKQISSTKAEYDYFKAMQLALKLILNGTYGAFGHPAFSVSNSNIANAITSMAREVINYMLDSIEDYFYNQWHNDKEIQELLGVVYISEKDNKFYYHKRNGNLIDKKGKDKISDILKWYNLSEEDFVENDKELFEIGEDKYRIVHKIFIHDFSNVKPFSQEYKIKPDLESNDGDKKRGVRKAGLIVYGDTDSSSCDTIIYTNNNTYKIADLYEKNIKNGSAGKTLKGHESVNCDELILNWSKEKKLYFASVKRLIRHKVTKEKWKLKTKSGKEITITNDHSLIVFRNNEQIEVKPRDVLKNDKILIIKNNI